MFEFLKRGYAPAGSSKKSRDSTGSGCENLSGNAERWWNCKRDGATCNTNALREQEYARSSKSVPNENGSWKELIIRKLIHEPSVAENGNASDSSGRFAPTSCGLRRRSVRFACELASCPTRVLVDRIDWKNRIWLASGGFSSFLFLAGFYFFIDFSQSSREFGSTIPLPIKMKIKMKWK